MKENRSKKRIIKLVDSNRTKQFSKEAKGQVALDYFQNIFKSFNPVNLSEFFEGFIPKVTPVMNEELIKDVSADEVKAAVFEIKSGSAPGADGLTDLFSNVTGA